LLTFVHYIAMFIFYEHDNIMYKVGKK